MTIFSHFHALKESAESVKGVETIKRNFHVNIISKSKMFMH